MKRIAALALLLAGCTHAGPDYHRPDIAVPGGFAERHVEGSVTDAGLASWWRGFGDPMLDTLVERALAQNPDVAMAAARIREARARETAAGAGGRPQLDAQAAASHTRISENSVTIPGAGGGGTGGIGFPGAEFDTFRVGFDAAWEIDLFGRTRRGVEAARARTAASEWSARDLQATAAAEVANAYLTLRTLQLRIANGRADLARQKEMEAIVAARVRGGLTGGLDLEQQRAERERAAAGLPGLMADAEAQIHALGVLTGTPPETLIDELAVPAPIPPAPPAVPPGLPSELLRRRPDIRAAERQLAAASADIGVAVADLYPRFSLTAAPALVSTALASLLSWGSRNLTASAGLAWPLLDGGRARANIAVANARQEQALIAYRKAVLSALKDVEDSLSRYEGDSRRLAGLERALAAAAAAEHLAATRYRGGLVTYSDVLAGRGRRISVEEQMIETKGSLARDSVALFKALGGGWPEAGAGQ